MTDPAPPAPAAAPAGVPRGALVFVLASAFLTAMGFGLVGPVLPFLVARFVPDAALAPTVGWLAASYALCAFLAAPLLGALSDRFGRRPVLLLSLLGSVAGYLLFGAAGALWMLFVGRVVDGLTAGSIGAVFALLADVTPREERGRFFGLVGATFGAGFIVGPAVGGLASGLGLSAPVYIAAGLTALSFLWGLLLVRETLPPGRRATRLVPSQLNPIGNLAALARLPGLRGLLVASALFALPFAMMQTALGVLGKDALGWGAAQASTAFIAVGVCDVVAQGLLLGWLLKRLGETRVAVLGLALAALGLALMAALVAFPLAGLLYGAVVAFAVGEGVFTASLGGLLSQAAPPDAQGRVQGGGQSLQSIAAVAGPLLAGPLYGRLGAWAPFALGALLVAVAAALVPGAARGAFMKRESDNFLST